MDNFTSQALVMVMQAPSLVMVALGLLLVAYERAIWIGHTSVTFVAGTVRSVSDRSVQFHPDLILPLAVPSSDPSYGWIQVNLNHFVAVTI